jgi:hypothetical protein
MKRVGGPAQGASNHVPGVCECHRCRGAQSGNELARTHGAYAAEVRLSAAPETRGLVEAIRAACPLYSPADDVMIELFAVTLTRISRAVKAVELADGLGRRDGLE